jgi:hypothetical protein
MHTHGPLGQLYDWKHIVKLQEFGVCFMCNIRMAFHF